MSVWVVSCVCVGGLVCLCGWSDVHCLSVQLLINDMENMFKKESLEIHVLLVWKHYIKLLGSVSYGSISFCLYKSLVSNMQC